MGTLYKTTLLLFALACLSGCASIISDSVQAISVDTPNCRDAKCTATNSNGTYFVSKTPGTISVNKAYGDLTLTCEKGNQRAVSIHKSSANVATFGNILLGGIPGALIDGGSGKGYDYQPMLINHLSCQPN
jgi:hypothetical protein